MVGDPAYAHEKLGVTVDRLAGEEGPLRNRLHDAFMSFHVLDPEGFSGDVGTQLESIRERFLAIPPDEATDNIRAFLDAMSDAEAQKLAHDIHRLSELIAVAHYKELQEDGLEDLF